MKYKDKFVLCTECPSMLNGIVLYCKVDCLGVVRVASLNDFSKSDFFAVEYNFALFSCIAMKCGGCVVGKNCYCVSFEAFFVHL